MCTFFGVIKITDYFFLLTWFKENTKISCHFYQLQFAETVVNFHGYCLIHYSPSFPALVNTSVDL